jgi:Zn-dependent peptidase ImmA (M78 family)
LHADDQVPRGPGAEHEASRFAAAFLMPARSVVAARLADAAVDQILAAKRTWNVSALALTHRLHELGLLTEWGYRTACVSLSRLGFRRAEPGGIPHETSQLLSKVFRALRDDGVPPRRIARDLAMSVAELNSHVFGLVPTALPGGTPDAPPRRPQLRLLPAEPGP